MKNNKNRKPYVRASRDLVLLSSEAAELVTQEGAVFVAARIVGSKLVVEPLHVPPGTRVCRVVTPKHGGGMTRFICKDLAKLLPPGQLPARWDDVRGRLEAELGPDGKEGA